MADFISGIAKIGIGGFILLIFVPIVVRSFWHKKTRDDLLSSPHVRNPTVLHRVVFAILTLLLLCFAIWLVLSGMSHFEAVFG